MAEIVVGNPVLHRALYLTMIGYTYLATSNPATGNGKIDTVELWAYDVANSLTGAVVGLCYGSDRSWTNRSNAAIGTVTGGAKRTFTDLELDCQEGDVIGVYASGRIECTATTTDGGLVTATGNFLDGANHNYASSYTGYAISLGGSGETVSAGNKAFMHYYKNMMAGGIR